MERIFTISGTHINRLEVKSYKLKKQRYNSSPCNINPDQNSAGESSSGGIVFDYEVTVAGLIGFGLGGLMV
jgi:hypothetical protein